MAVQALHDAIETMRAGAGAVALPRAVVRVAGEDPLAFLHATTSKDVRGLDPSRGALACVLNEKGRIQAEVRVVVLEDGSVLLDGEPACLPALTGWLARIAPLSGCEILDESAEWRLLAIAGSGAAAAAGVPDLPANEHAVAAAGVGLAVRVVWGAAGVDLLLPAGAAGPAVEPVPLEAWDAERIAGGRPRFGIDFDDGTLVNETPLLRRAVSLDKGCYPGQESVARVHNLGTPRYRLAGLAAGEPMQPGASVRYEDAEVGSVTSAAVLPEGARAIARIRTSVPAGASVDAGVAAVVADLP